MIITVKGVFNVAAKVQDYVKAIKKLKEEALETNQTEIVIRAGDLHRQVNKGTPTLVTCCMAMKKMMLEDDSFVKNPENKSGASAHLTVRYQVKDLAHRLPLFSSKQRGRKKGFKLEKKEEKKSSVQETIEQWLKDSGFSYEIDRQLILVSHASATWKIRVAIARGRRAFELDDIVFSLLKYADEATDKYSICMNASKDNMKDWDRISPVLREKMNLTALFVKDGIVTEK